MTNEEHTARAVEGAAMLVAFHLVRRPDALLVDHLLLLIVLADAGPFEDDGLRVGELLIVVEEVFAPQGGDSGRVGIDLQTPAGDIEVVDAVVAHVAGAEVVPPAP